MIGGEPRPKLHQAGHDQEMRREARRGADAGLIDGAVGAKFLQTLRRLIENPLMLVY